MSINFFGFTFGANKEESVADLQLRILAHQQKEAEALEAEAVAEKAKAEKEALRLNNAITAKKAAEKRAKSSLEGWAKASNKLAAAKAALDKEADTDFLSGLQDYASTIRNSNGGVAEVFLPQQQKPTPKKVVSDSSVGDSSKKVVKSAEDIRYEAVLKALPLVDGKPDEARAKIVVAMTKDQVIQACNDIVAAGNNTLRVDLANCWAVSTKVWGPVPDVLKRKFEETDDSEYDICDDSDDSDSVSASPDDYVTPDAEPAQKTGVSGLELPKRA